MPDTFDVLRGFRFKVSIDSLQEFARDGESSYYDMGFMKISGLQADVGVYEWQQVTDPVTVYKLPDRIKFSDLVLERGVITERTSLWSWFNRIEDVLANTYMQGKLASFRSNLSITVFDKGYNFPRGSVQWRIFSAFPRSIKFGDFDANSSSVLIESLTLAHEGYRRVSVSPPMGDFPASGFPNLA